jgi:quinol monooxygenase YgiN
MGRIANGVKRNDYDYVDDDDDDNNNNNFRFAELWTNRNRGLESHNTNQMNVSDKQRNCTVQC